MDLTTIERVKAHIGKSTPDMDGTLSILITATSAMVERYLRRHVQSTSRTEYYDVAPATCRVFLRGVPVTTITTIHNDDLREYGSSTLIDSDDYTITERIGEVAFDYILEPGTNALKVVYTGGMAASTGAFIAAFPEVAYAVELQTIEAYRRRGIAGASASTLDGGSTTFVGQHRFLDHVREILDMYALRVPV